MNASSLVPLAASLALAGPCAALAQEAVANFPGDRSYADAGGTAQEIESTEASLRQWAGELARRHLRPGDTLTLDFTDIDLAGSVRHRSRGDVRVVRGGADVPRLEFRWRLEPARGDLAQGEARLTDLGYRLSSLERYRSDSLPYERRLLERWFKETFGPAAP